MKLRKALAGVAAAAVATVSLSAASFADLIVPDSPDAGLSTGTSMWLVQLFNVGAPEEGKPATDFGINYADVAKISVIVKATEAEWLDGGFGGGLIWSVNGGDIAQGTELWDKYNWSSAYQFWGIDDPELEINTVDTSKDVQAKKVGDYTYELTADVYASNPLHNGDASEIGCMQTGIQYWGNDMSDYEVISCTAYDNAGNVLVSFDSNGTPDKSSSAAAPATDPAPAATGDVQAAADSSKGSPDTGIADVAAVAGAAVLAGGALVLARKRK